MSSQGDFFDAQSKLEGGGDDDFMSFNSKLSPLSNRPSMMRPSKTSYYRGEIDESVDYFDVGESLGQRRLS